MGILQSSLWVSYQFAKETYVFLVMSIHLSKEKYILDPVSLGSGGVIRILMRWPNLNYNQRSYDSLYNASMNSAILWLCFSSFNGSLQYRKTIEFI